MATTRSATLDDVSPQRLKRYWRYFTFYNGLSSLSETMASLVFFIVLQRLFKPRKPLEPSDILTLAIGTFLGLATFIYFQRAYARSALERHVLPHLPPPFFVDQTPRFGQETSELITFSDREESLNGMRRTATVMALAALCSYFVWSVAVAVTYGNIGSPWAIVLSCTLVGAFMSRLYYLRLRQIDFEPLLALEWGKDNEHSALYDKNHMYVQKTLVNRRRFKRIPRSRLHNLTILHVQWKARMIVRLISLLGITDDFLFSRAKKTPSNVVGELEARVNKAVGLRQAYAAWEGTTSVLIVGVFFFAVTKGSRPIDSGGKIDEWVAAAVMALFVLTLYLPRILAFIVVSLGRDVTDGYERASAEAFGFISEKVAEDEHHSEEGRFDERTGLMRYGVFYRKTIDVLLRMVAGMTNKEPGESAFELSPPDTAPQTLSDFSILLFDIDNFKTFNGIFGYMVADHVLYGVSRVIIDAATEHEGFAGRYGGEEFCVVVPGMGAESARHLAKEIKDRISLEILIDRTDEGSIQVIRSATSRRPTCATLWTSDKREYADDFDRSEVFPNLKRARTEVAAYDEGSSSIEEGKILPLRNLISGTSGKIWLTTVSVGVGGGADLRRMLGMRISLTQFLKVDYVGVFRRIFAKLNSRVDAAKLKGRNRVI